MAITSLDQAIAGMQPARHFLKAFNAPTLAALVSSWGLAGVPGAGSYDTTLNGVVLDSTGGLIAGQLPIYTPASGFNYLARSASYSSASGALFLFDRLWHNGGYTITSAAAQNSTTPTWPARDINGATAGDGVLLGLELSVASGAASPTITVGYTNSAGVAGRTGVNAFATQNPTAVNTFFPMTLQAGDTGVQSLQSVTLSGSWVSGTMNMVAYRPLALIGYAGFAGGEGRDLINLLMPLLYTGSVPYFVFNPLTNAGNNLTGAISYTQG